MAYTCEKAVGPGKSCDFRSGRMILQQPVEREQMKKLLATGRTDLLTDFVSKKGRKFKAFLVKNPDGKIGFEFQPRKEKPAEPKAAAESKAKRPEEKPAAKKAAKKRRSA
jgi:DNA topoisomerase-3